MGGHGHHKVEIPDYKIYKVEDAPELMAVQERLAARGLKDPWLRNEVWRYNQDLSGGKTVKQRVSFMIFRGFKTGFALFAATILGEIAYKMMNKDGKTPPTGPSHTSYGETPPSDTSDVSYDNALDVGDFEASDENESKEYVSPEQVPEYVSPESPENDSLDSDIF